MYAPSLMYPAISRVRIKEIKAPLSKPGTRMSHVPDMNVFPAYQSHVTHINASCHKYRFCMSNSCTGNLQYLNECHLNEYDLSHIQKMRHAPHV